MTVKTHWIKDDRIYIVSLRFMPEPIWVGIEKMSVIVEIRTKEEKIIEVWHLIFHIWMGR
ncbi:MAG: hypothetical protein ACE5K4_12080 [Candidatus Hydrothermarchaeota archaeon]